MKKIILLCCIASLLISCNKNKKPDYRYRLIGYIYNSHDSTPFANTEFKVFRVSNNLSGKKVEEEFFTTDDIGHFDLITSIAGVLTWPAYFDGAVYTGPPFFVSQKETSTTDESNRIYNINYDTLYTTPFH